MHRNTSIFQSALLLTGVNLLLRFAGTSFQVYLSGRIGAAGIGLLQLTMSVGSLAMIAGMAGIRTTAMYLTAEELGKGTQGGVYWVLSGCIRYSLCCSAALALGLSLFAPLIAEKWVAEVQVVPALRLFAGFLPVTCLCGVMTGYFTASGRIRTLAAVEVAEQLFSMTVTVMALTCWAGSSAVRACESVILGSGMGACLTLGMLVLLRLREKHPIGPRQHMGDRLMRSAIPLAIADVLRSGISTLENLMVPQRLALCPQIRDPLAAFGRMSGMVFPVLMFPACLLYGLAELLIPELSRCQASGNQRRIRYLVRRGLKVALIYGLIFGGGMFLVAQPLCQRLYGEEDAGVWLQRYTIMIPMLYCDALTDAMTKGLGQQKTCVYYNIFTSLLDVGMLFFLLPRYGMSGYYISFLISHGVNFLLSLRLLLKLTGQRVPARIPVLCGLGGLGAVWGGSMVTGAIAQVAVFLLLLGCLLTLAGIVRRKDAQWLLGLAGIGK